MVLVPARWLGRFHRWSLRRGSGRGLAFVVVPGWPLSGARRWQKSMQLLHTAKLACFRGSAPRYSTAARRGRTTVQAACCGAAAEAEPVHFAQFAACSCMRALGKLRRRVFELLRGALSSKCRAWSAGWSILDLQTQPNRATQPRARATVNSYLRAPPKARPLRDSIGREVRRSSRYKSRRAARSSAQPARRSSAQQSLAVAAGTVRAQEHSGMSAAPAKNMPRLRRQGPRAQGEVPLRPCLREQEARREPAAAAARAAAHVDNGPPRKRRLARELRRAVAQEQDAPEARRGRRRGPSRVGAPRSRRPRSAAAARAAARRRRRRRSAGGLPKNSRRRTPSLY